MNDHLSEAINLVDLPGLVGELYPGTGARAGKAGAYRAVWRGEENPSFSIFKSRTGIWMWKDFATGDEGNAFHFLVKVADMNKQDAAHKLLLRTGLDPNVPLPKTRAQEKAPEKKGPTPCEAIPVPPDVLDDLLAFTEIGIAPCLGGRGLSADDAVAYGLRVEGSDALIPITDPNGVVIGVKKKHAVGKIRYSYPISKHGAPAWCSPGFLESRRVLIVEGELNGIIAHSVLRENGNDMAVMGIAGAGQYLHLSVLEERHVFIYADDDDPGRGALARWAKEAKEAGAASISLLEPFPEDFCDTAGKQGRDTLYRQLAERCQNANQYYGILDREIGYYTVRELRELAKRYIQGEILIPTGFPEIDLYTGGLPESGIVLVCGLPSMGKSVLMRDMVLNYLEANHEHKAMIFSPDQSVSSMAKLMASRLSNVPAWRIRTGIYPPAVLEIYGGPDEARKAWQEAYDFVLTSLTKRLFLSEEDYLPTIKEEVEKALDKGVGMFAGDYIQIFEMETDDGQEIEGKAIKEFKKHVRHWKVPFIFATQLAKYKFPMSRKSGIPISNDIEGSGKIFQAAEQCYMIYNYDIYTDEYKEEAVHDVSSEYIERGRRFIPKARIYVRKNKEGRRNDYRYLLWDAEVPRFRNLGDICITPGGGMKVPSEGF